MNNIKIKTVMDLYQFICNSDGVTLEEFLDKYGNIKIGLLKEFEIEVIK